MQNLDLLQLDIFVRVNIDECDHDSFTSADCVTDGNPDNFIQHAQLREDRKLTPQVDAVELLELPVYVQGAPLA